MELLTHGGEHHEIGHGGWLMMMTATDSPLRSPERTPDQPSRERLGLGAAPYCKTRWNFLSNFFLRESKYIELELRSVEPQGAHEAGARPRGGRAPTLVDRVWAPGVDSSASIFNIFQKYVPWSFRSFRELLFLHINNTRVILLKTVSVRVSSIQSMQVRVQNKGKSVWKSRYGGEVSTRPRLNPCLSLSNSVDKPKVIKKNFYKLFFSSFCKHV